MDTINLRPLHFLACSLLLAACDSTIEEPIGELDDPIDPAPIGEVAANEQQQVPVNGQAPIVDCPSARVIGILHDAEGSCALRGQLPPGWIWTAMFEHGSPEVESLSMPVPDGLRGYCMFEYTNGKPTLEHYGMLFTAINNYGLMSLDSVAADCRGEFTQSDLNDPSLGFELHEAFRDNVDWVSPSELGGTIDERVGVDMAVVDTVSQKAFDDDIQPRNKHGLQMAALIADIACPDADPACLERQHFTLAMPREDWATPPDWIVGGLHATQGDVALGVYHAVASWQERRVVDPGNWSPRLVINLSLGWQRLTQDTNDLDRGPTKSLLSALQYASCQGALVMVAAGNNPDEGCPGDHKDPLAPAVFEEFQAPTKAECDQLGFTSPTLAEYPVFGQQGDYMPLVHAVGGVDEYDQPLINARINGRPRLAALGSNGVVASAGGSTEPLTGSSVATAVASGAAALLWSYRPDLRPDEVVQLLHSSGLPLGEQAEFGLGGPGNYEINRISVCSALRYGCVGQDPDYCPELECKPEEAVGNMDNFFAEVDAIMADPNTKVDEIPTNLHGDAPVCEQFNWNELAAPQPNTPICARCNMFVPSGTTFGDDMVKMTTDSAYDGLVVNAWLTVKDGAGMTSAYTFDNAVVSSLNSPTTDVTVAYIDAPTAASATLNVTLVDGTTQSNSISVQKQ